MIVFDFINTAGQYVDRTLWGVHVLFHTGQSTIFCFTVRKTKNTYTVWGYNQWEDYPGFRTLGISPQQFLQQYQQLVIFTDVDDALNYVRTIVIPKCSPIQTPEDKSNEARLIIKNLHLDEAKIDIFGINPNDTD